jgi:DNA-binding PadR family transcriptional regulator
MRDPSPSSLEFALLGMLALKPQSGYDLRKLFADTPMRHFSDSPGSIYPALGRLENRKWVTAVREKNSARRRQEFQVTPAGKRALVEWLEEPFTRDDVIWEMDSLLLRFAFFDDNLMRRRASSFLARLEGELEAYIGELESYAAASGLLNSVSTGALAFSNGLEAYRAHLSWTRRARKKLSAVHT